ncbi:MAG TPA: hypothetical protein VHY20_07085 [Pirellulales bacterium]|nr:hypothetical protein [Pirellulales bacterium]
MKPIGLFAATALVAAMFWVTPNSAAAWTWNPFAKKTDPHTTAAAQPTAKSDKAASDGLKLKQAARAASKADKAAAERSPAVAGKPIWSPVSNRYRWNVAQKQPSAARRALNSTVDTLTLKPLRDKLSGNPTKRNTWSKTPPVTNTSNPPRRSAFSSLFKSKAKPKPKSGPQTVGEWINQDRPAF